VTGPAPGADLLARRVFRALFRDFDMVTVTGTHIAVPARAASPAAR
jgi:hypothetical protein